MLETFIRTLVIVFLMEIGSASQFMMASAAAHSRHPWVVWAAGMTALCLTSFLGVRLGRFIHGLPISADFISGIVMLCLGLFFLYKAHP